MSSHPEEERKAETDIEPQEEDEEEVLAVMAAATEASPEPVRHVPLSPPRLPPRFLIMNHHHGTIMSRRRRLRTEPMLPSSSSPLETLLSRELSFLFFQPEGQQRSLEDEIFDQVQLDSLLHYSEHCFERSSEDHKHDHDTRNQPFALPESWICEWEQCPPHCLEKEISQKCLICLEMFHDRQQKIVKIPCDHLFHIDCLETAMQFHHQRCPTCYTSLHSFGPPEHEEKETPDSLSLLFSST